MDLTKGTEEEKIKRSKKMMLWFAIISMGMMFAGITSGYIVSRNRPDWINDFQLPSSFLYSTILIVLSSVALYFVKSLILKEKRSNATLLLILTLLLGSVFIALQFYGFQQILAEGYYFTGSASSITTTFVYLIVIAHIAHVVAGLIVLLVLIYNHFKQRYKAGQMLGLELGATFWHFVDVLWIILFLFLYFIR
ncbi:cytochrome c oxidase subunit 3 [Mesonia sp.]|uniref:cytochrome c oxidase subunit 3 n=1 Tax=Mesonia sp. TaxID=1960830 RepID=UPI001756A576|nr:cytochrome c oxidase subunit 3 [Mesonia sp.]HIB36513.1 heme-copper oxidase subunit III [Mesonia sp.]HIO26655.1 heme-copper oxidase subunit III [Flavobacteriaceae bacterium]